MTKPWRLLSALLVALLGALAQCKYIQKREQALLYDSETIPTLVAKQDIPSRFKLDETMVEIIDVPRKWRQPKALTEIEDILGQITSSPVLSGEQLLSTKLVRPDEAGLAFHVPKKYRAVAVAINEITASGGHIKPGNYVDVIGTFDFGQGEKSDLRAVTLFQNVWVLSVGGDIGHPTARSVAEEEQGSKPEDTRMSQSITLALTPEEAQKLVLSQEIGNIHLSLRSLWETETTMELEHTTVNSALGIKQRVRHRQASPWRVIRSGGY